MKIDKGAIDIYNRLTTLHAQIRSIGVNYNQVTKALNVNFNERRAMALLSKLVKYTEELKSVEQKVIEVTDEFERKWLE